MVLLIELGWRGPLRRLRRDRAGRRGAGGGDQSGDGDASPSDHDGVDGLITIVECAPSPATTHNANRSVLHSQRQCAHLALSLRERNSQSRSLYRPKTAVDRQPTGEGPFFRSDAKVKIMSTDELLAEALRLTRVDRARVAEELLSSLEESDEEVATAWATELERRSREVAEGRVQTISWETARTEILKELEQRRAPRTAS